MYHPCPLLSRQQYLIVTICEIRLASHGDCTPVFAYSGTLKLSLEVMCEADVLSGTLYGVAHVGIRVFI